eukprot:2031710-Pyramimonas_sp.AAC.1
MSAGPTGRSVGKSGTLDTGLEKGTGLWGGACTVAVPGTGGPVNTSQVAVRCSRRATADYGSTRT